MTPHALVSRIAGALLLLATSSAVFALNPNHQCSFCHNLHGAVITPPAQQQTMCLTCHGPAGTSTLKAAEHRNAQNSQYPTFNFACRNCHDPHDSLNNWQTATTGRKNIKMVGLPLNSTNNAMLATPNNGNQYVLFESRGSGVGQPTLHSFADNNQDGQTSPTGLAWDAVCEVCHTLTKHHTNKARSSHQTGNTCTTSCHKHSWGFMRQALP